MAELSVDFTNDQSRYEAVIIQRDRGVLDGELNDMQRITRVRAYRQQLTADVDDSRRAAQWGRCRVNNIEIVPGTNPDEVQIQPVTLGGASFGLIAYRGYTFEITTPIVLTGLAAAGGAAEYQQIYFTIAEEEVSAADEPSIAVEKLGETARRTRLVVTFALGAVNTNTAGPLHTLEEPWEGGTKACVMGVILRAAAAALPITVAQIQPLWRLPTTVARFQERNAFIGPNNPETDAYAAWSPSLGELQMIGLALYVPGQVGTEATPKILAHRFTSSAITIADGQALWMVVERGQIGLGASSSGPTYAVDATWPTSSTNVGRLIVEDMDNLDQQALSTRDDDNLDERYLICFRDGDCLIFRNGGSLGAGGVDSEDPLTGRQIGVLHFGHRGSFDFPQVFDPNTPDVDADQTAAMRDRYVPTAGSMRVEFEGWGPDDGGGQQLVRIYNVNDLNNFSGFIFTQNAMWDETQWRADDPAVGSSAMRIGTNASLGVAQFSVSSRTAGGTDPWLDTEWPLGSDALPSVLALYAGGALSGADIASAEINGFRRLELTGTGDPAHAATVVRNTQYGANIVKAWATISITAGVITVLDSFGLDADPTQAGTYVQFVLDRAMSNDYYAVVVTSNSDEYVYRVQRVAGGTTFRVTGYNPATTTALNYAADSDSFNVIVIGRHA